MDLRGKCREKIKKWELGESRITKRAMQSEKKRNKQRKGSRREQDNNTESFYVSQVI